MFTEVRHIPEPMKSHKSLVNTVMSKALRRISY